MYLILFIISIRFLKHKKHYWIVKKPFYAETLKYVENLRAAGVPADVDVYPTDMHAFDMLRPQDAVSQEAIQNFERHFEQALRMKP